MLGTADDTRLHNMAKVLQGGAAKEALRLVDVAASEGVAAGQFTEQLLGYFRDLVAVAVGCPAEMQRHTNESLHAELAELGAAWGVQRLLAIIGMIDQTLVRIRHTVHGRVLLEACLVQVCHLPDLQAIADVAASVAGGGSIAMASPTKPSDEKKNIEPPRVTSPAVSRAPASPAIASASVSARIDLPVPTVGSPRELAANRPVSAVAVPTVSTALVSAKPVGPSPLASKPQGTAGGSAVATAPLPPANESPVIVIANGPVILKTRVQRQRDMEAYPYIKSCIDMFDGEIIRIDNPS